MQILSRYYSNAFSDNDKQNSINLLLGVFTPGRGPAIWDLTTDFHLHNELNPSGRSCSQWWDEGVMSSLPLALAEEIKTSVIVGFPESEKDESVDGYLDFYRPNEFSTLSELLTFTMSHSCRDFMPNFTTDFSPFSVRVRPGKRMEAALGKVGLKSPSLMGLPSTNSIASSNDSSSESGSDTEEELDPLILEKYQNPISAEQSPVTLESMCPNCETFYGNVSKEPSADDQLLYKK
jgi:hypothetical protein